MRGNNTIRVIDISDLTAVDGKYKIYTDGIFATGFEDVYTAILKNAGGDEVQRVTYNTNSYVASMHTTSIGALVKAMYNYGVSAKDYKTA